MRSIIKFSVTAFLIFANWLNPAVGQKPGPVLAYTVSMPDAVNHFFHVELSCTGWPENLIDFKMPGWMPGYYQMMHYSKAVNNLSAKTTSGIELPVKQVDDNSWQLTISKKVSFKISYDVKADRRFVANSYLDTTHAYIVPNSVFLYIPHHLNLPVQVKIKMISAWPDILTGLENIPGKKNEFLAPDFDLLYDSPLLIGKLERLPPFKIKGIPHRFEGYRLGRFKQAEFMKALQKVVEAAVNIIGDIPYQQYSFMAIGPGRGGIEHLNSTTVSFDGSELDKPGAMNRVMSFLAHEYFHHYNVKRIRPFELGPFDYDQENKTNLLWVSEGLSVYYEYLIVKRAGLIEDSILLQNFEHSINSFENSTGRIYQSLTQASFETWRDGPFGNQGPDSNRSISYYDKGPAVGLILDFAIRHATSNHKSLDDVMRQLYWKYYKGLKRGFTDAEFQQACEDIAGIPLSKEFEFVYTAKELDYNKYLNYAGLKLVLSTDAETKIRRVAISKLEQTDPLQKAIQNSWLNPANPSQ